MNESTPHIPRPLPRIDPDHLPWWEGLHRHELLVQECPACRRCVFPPQPACPYCRSLERGWRRSSGRGKVYSWVIMHRASHPWFADRIPYAVVLVEMEEGFRVVGSIDCPLEQLRDGLPVEVGFEDVDERITLLRFRPSEGADA
jgi:uncharacterized OB-fold protein